jgi:hypothetical protein
MNVCPSVGIYNFALHIQVSFKLELIILNFVVGEIRNKYRCGFIKIRED